MQILATDLALEDSLADWVRTGQHAANLEALYRSEIIDRATFAERVRFRPADMRNLALPWQEQFDFVWSSCSIEHLGGLGAGLDFVENAMELLKPGGVAAHTTEFNVGASEITAEEG